MHFLIGTDPEFFIGKTTSVAICAHGLVPGTKHNPYRVEDGAVQVDGMALEFNIDPTDRADEFLSRVKKVMGITVAMANDTAKEKLVPIVKPVVHFSNKEFSNAPADAKILGCDPDYNAITGEVNPNPGDQLLDYPARTASGHIHIGWTRDALKDDPSHFEDCRLVAEHFLRKGVFPTVTYDERRRLEYYGMNGSFRPKSYGVELRAPSNLWLKSDASILNTFNKVFNTFKEFAGA